MGIKHITIDLGFMHQYFKSSLLEGADAIPEGHYAADNMKSTVVPFRNGIMLSIAIGIAESNNLKKVFIANHGGAVRHAWNRRRCRGDCAVFVASRCFIVACTWRADSWQRFAHGVLPHGIARTICKDFAGCAPTWRHERFAAPRYRYAHATARIVLPFDGQTPWLCEV